VKNRTEPIARKGKVRTVAPKPEEATMTIPRSEKIEIIVRAMAEMDPVEEHGYCVFCYADELFDHDAGKYETHHTGVCPWRLAHEATSSTDVLPVSALDPFFGYHKDLPFKLDPTRPWDA